MANFGRKTYKRSPRLLVLFLILGALVGGLVGTAIDAFIPALSVLTKTIEVLNVPPTVLNTEILKITLGFVFKINLITSFGIIIALLLYRKF
jgi:hypothetical protein